MTRSLVILLLLAQAAQAAVPMGFFKRRVYEAAAPAAWTPASESGLILWYKADDAAFSGYTNDQPVATWPDRSGNARDAVQATGSAQPLYKTGQWNGLPAIVFDGADDIMYFTMAPNFGLTNQFTVTVSFSTTNTLSAFQGPFGHHSNGFAGFQFVSENNAAAFLPHLTTKDSGTTETSNKKGPLAMIPGTNYTYTWTFTNDTPTVTLVTNGVDSTAANGTSGFASPGGAIGKGYSAGAFKQASVKEIAVWNRLLPAAALSSNAYYFTNSARWVP